MENSRHDTNREFETIGEITARLLAGLDARKGIAGAHQKHPMATTQARMTLQNNIAANSNVSSGSRCLMLPGPAAELWQRR